MVGDSATAQRASPSGAKRLWLGVLLAFTATLSGCQIIASRSGGRFGFEGGSTITLLATSAPHTTVTQVAMNADLAVVRRRLDQLTRTGTAAQKGRDQIVVQLQGIHDPQHIVDLITKPGLLELVDTKEQSLPQGTEWTGLDTVILPNNSQFHISKRVVFTGSDLQRAEVTTDQFNRPQVTIIFTDAASKSFASYTAAHIGTYITVCLDNRVISSPTINAPISEGRAVIEGGFTRGAARDLAILLQSGPLALPLKATDIHIVAAN